MGSRQTVIPPPPPGFTEVIGGGPLPPPPPGFTEDLTPRPGIIESFVDRGIESVKGAGNLALDAAKSATSLEGQATFLPRLAKGLYEGAVDAGAGAIARQFPQGVDNLPESELLVGAARGGAAAVPVIGPYVMNKVSDIEEGNWRKVVGETLFDLATAGAGPKAPGAAKAAVTKTAGVIDDLRPAVNQVLEDRYVTAAGGSALGAGLGGMVAGPPGAAVGGTVGGFAGAVLAAKRALRAATERQAMLDSFKSAADEVKLKEAADRTGAKVLSQAEKTAAKADAANAKLDLGMFARRAKQDAKTAKSVLDDLKVARRDSMGSASIEVGIFEQSLKTQAAINDDLAAAAERLSKAEGMSKLKAQRDFDNLHAEALKINERVDKDAARVVKNLEKKQIEAIKMDRKMTRQAETKAAKEASATAQPPAATPPPAPGFTEMLQERVQAPATAPKLDALGRTPEQRAYAAATTLAIKEIPWESAKTQLAKQHPGTPIDALEKAFKAAPKRLYETVSAHLRSGLTPTQAVKLLKENGLSVGGESSMLGHMKAELGAIGDKMTPAQRFEYTQLSRTKTAKGMKFKDLKPYEP